MPNDKEECKRGALAIETHIDKQLELLKLSIPQRVWIVDPEKQYSAGLEIIYTCESGRKITVAFDANEVRCFRRRPRVESLQKILEVAIEIHRNGITNTN